MIGVNTLQDLKVRLKDAGFEILGSEGWFVDTIHGRWSMAFGEIYIDGGIVKNIKDVPVLKKVKKETVKKEKADKKKSNRPTKKKKLKKK